MQGIIKYRGNSLTIDVADESYPPQVIEDKLATGMMDYCEETGFIYIFDEDEEIHTIAKVIDFPRK